MDGITAHVDHNATMALLRSNAKCLNDEEEGNKLWKPAKLSQKLRRYLQTIIAGSIRAPHRLMNAKLMNSDVCQHPACKGCRATTTHIFWECKAHDDIRAKYENAINKKLEYVKKWDKAAHTELKKILSNNCFKNCGICPSNPEQLNPFMNLKTMIRIALFPPIGRTYVQEMKTVTA